MRCPRCETSVDDAAVRCPACRAPLQLVEEPPPSRLDVDLALDRRRDRKTPAPGAARGGDLGDLSFDPPADDSAWTFGAGEGGADEVAAELGSGAPEADDAPGDGEPLAAPPPALTPPPLPPPLPDAGFTEPAFTSAQPAEPTRQPELALGFAPRLAEPGGETPMEADGDDVAAAPAADAPAVRRGRWLSLGAIALAAIIALIAALTSR